MPRITGSHGLFQRGGGAGTIVAVAAVCGRDGVSARYTVRY